MTKATPDDTPRAQSSQPAMDQPKLMSSTLLMASGTLVSRFLGAVRVLLAGYLFISQSVQADIFSIGTAIPNQMYLLFAGGILNAILVPQLMKSMRHDADGGQGFSDRIVTLFGLIILSLTILLIIFHRYVVALVTSSSWRDPARAVHYQSLTTLTLLVLPQVFFFGAFFLGGQILNSRGSFGPMMWAPAINNVIQVAMLATYAVIWGFHTDTQQAFTSAQIVLLGVGSLIGIIAQAAILIPFLKKVGFRYRPRFDFLHTGLGATARVATWAIAMVLATQVNYIIVTRMAGGATHGGSGAGSYILGASMLIFFLPHSLLTVSLATALLPTLSHLAAGEQWENFMNQLQSSLRIIYAAIIPLAFLILVVGLPVGVAGWGIERGGAYIGWTLVVFSLGLIPLTLQHLMDRVFFSMSNTRTPFFIEVLFVSITSGIAILGVVVFSVPSVWVAPCIAGGYVLGYVGAAFLGWRLFKRAIPFEKKFFLTGHMMRLVAISIPSALAAGLVVWGTIKPVIAASFHPELASELPIPGQGMALIGSVSALIVGCGVYLVLAKLFKISEITELMDLVRRKLRKEPTGGV
ncbi:MAG: hypothetical protein FWG15_08035 [Propionibacteriaceae bacterium]|nr:hypothetical protein [Propionibacteriaceae bacterium]